ncbi:MAG TPA: hypothetical protein VHV08_09700, partial [Pirellulales bacterium]|nr:hypothetical protein [Pirellulales bacterium]
QHPTFVFQWAQADFDRKIAAILAAPRERQTAAHRPHGGMLEKKRSLGRVPVTNALWHEHFDRLPHQFVATIAEQPLGLAVYQDDGSCFINDHQGVGRCLDKALKVFDDSDLASGSDPIRGVANGRGEGQLWRVGAEYGRGNGAGHLPQNILGFLDGARVGDRDHGTRTVLHR